MASPIFLRIRLEHDRLDERACERAWTGFSSRFFAPFMPFGYSRIKVFIAFAATAR